MKTMTKEWVKSLEFHDLIIMLEPTSNKKIPFVFTNGGTDIVKKEDLITVKTKLNVTEKENEISYIMLPDTFDLDFDFLNDEIAESEKTHKNYFLLQYLNRLRVISYIPENILKTVKDKRMLALGYVEEETKNEILKYIKGKYSEAFDIYEICSAASLEAEKGLTIHEQFKRHLYINSVPFLFDGVKITKAENINDTIYLTIDDNITVVFSEAKIIENEIDIVNSYVSEIELYKKENYYELHFLIMKRDENFIDYYYYVTYSFKDLKFKN